MKNRQTAMLNRDLSYIYYGRVSIPNLFSTSLKVGMKVRYAILFV